MGVIVEAINVIVPISALASRFGDDPSYFLSLVPNDTFCHDGYLGRVGFTAPPDVDRFVKLLVSAGLRFFNGTEFEEIAIVDQMTGLTAPCKWLNVGRYPDGICVAWLVGTAAEPLFTPVGWKPSKFTFVPNAAITSDTFLPLSRENGADVFLNMNTGREMLLDRTSDKPLL
jgi:hypothetical protein